MTVLTDLVLEHYTDQPLVFDPRREYGQDKPRGIGKPVGFWVSVAGEDDWPSWCRDQEYYLAGLKHRSRVVLHDDANILLISTGDELMAFHDKFCVDDPDFPRARHWMDDERKYWSVHWPAVAALYQGVIIAPYLWSHRLDGPMWYYGWDCASGCIWDLDAIWSVTPQAEAQEGFPWGATACRGCGQLRTEFGDDGMCLGCGAREFMKTIDVPKMMTDLLSPPPREVSE